MLQKKKKGNGLKDRERAIKIGLLGACFNTGNLGVSALADASVKLLLEKWPNREIIFIGSGYEPKTENITIGATQKKIVSIPVRFSKNVFHKCHFLRFLLYGVAGKLGFKITGNKYVKLINSCDLVCDITGGDSFSDIYGFKRFFLGFLTKWLFVFLGKDLLMLPQTYGPFKKNISKIMAAYILKKTKAVYSRDKKGIDYAHKLLNGLNTEKVKLCPDVAFLLDTESWDDKAIQQIVAAKGRGRQIIGLNVSGLLYNGGYTQDNMFGLALDYPELIKQIIDYFLTVSNITLVLIPHVFPEDGLSVESDPTACKAIYDCLAKEQQKNVILPEKEPNQRQIKYLIGKCDFFMGARMHSCIAALSQGIPAAGMAYSDKFAGVFQIADGKDYVVDMRQLNETQILDRIKQLYETRECARRKLTEIIPSLQKKVMSVFDVC